MPSVLPNVLFRQGILGGSQIDAVTSSGALRGRAFAQRLYQSGLVDADQIYALLLAAGARDATPRLDPLPAPRLLALVPSRFAEEGCLVPFARAGNRLLIAMLDPSDERVVEELSLFTGLVVEPYIARSRELFRARFEAYGLEPPTPLARFVVEDAFETTLLPPPPSEVLPAVATKTAAEPAAEHAWPADVFDDETPARGIFGSVFKSPLINSVTQIDPATMQSRQLYPAQDESASSQSQHKETNEAAVTVAGWLSTKPLPSRAEGWLQSPAPQDLIRARDAVSEQVLWLLTPSFTRAVFFLVQREVAVGWDGIGPNAERDRIKDVLIPLTPSSTLRLALTTREVVTGHIADMEALDRILINFFGEPRPLQWIVVPLLTSSGVAGLLYADNCDKKISIECRDLAFAIATTVGDSLESLLSSFGRVI